MRRRPPRQSSRRRYHGPRRVARAGITGRLVAAAEVEKVGHRIVCHAGLRCARALVTPDT